MREHLAHNALSQQATLHGLDIEGQRAIYTQNILDITGLETAR